jgi:Flp pilus assembly protein TadG
MARMSRFLSDVRGAAAMEFALVAPAFVAVLIGIAQLGILFFANAGLNDALAEGARYATIYPQPTEAQIKARINAKKFGLDPTRLTVSSFTYGTANSSNFATITMSYSVPLNFVFFNAGPVTLRQSRRAYLQPET